MLLKTQANIHKPLPRQKCANLLAALDSLYVLLAPIPQQQAGNQVGKPASMQMLALTASLHSRESVAVVYEYNRLLLSPGTYTQHHIVRI